MIPFPQGAYYMPRHDNAVTPNCLGKRYCVPDPKALGGQRVIVIAQNEILQSLTSGMPIHINDKGIASVFGEPNANVEDGYTTAIPWGAWFRAVTLSQADRIEAKLDKVLLLLEEYHDVLPSA